MFGLSKAYFGTQALIDASLAVGRGEIHALVGGNGSGKSTLIKILAGVCVPDAGEVEVNGLRIPANQVTPEWAHESGLGFVHQDLGLFDDLTVAENLFSGLPYPRTGGRIDWKALNGSASEILDKLDVGVSPNGTVADLRASSRTLIAVARALRGREDLHAGALVLDEPTARLASAEVDQLLEKLHAYASQGQSVLYVSHRLEEVLSFVEKITVLRDGEVVANKAAKELSPGQLAALVTGREIAEMSVASETEDADSHRFDEAPVVLDVEGLSCGVIRDCEIKVRAGEVLGLAGLVGAGRSTFLRAVFGAVPRSAGTVTVAGKRLRRSDTAEAVGAGVGFVPEDRGREGAFLELGVRENLMASQLASHRNGWLRLGKERSAASAAIKSFEVKSHGLDGHMAHLSGGNQQKVILARWLTGSTRLLLLDEPTQGVDVGARADIYRLIQDASRNGLAVVVASADADELLELCDRVVVLTGGRISAEVSGSELTHSWLVDNVYGDTHAGEVNQ